MIKIVNGNTIVEFIESKCGALEEEFIKANSLDFVDFVFNFPYVENDMVEEYLLKKDIEFNEFATQQYAENKVI